MSDDKGKKGEGRNQPTLAQEVAERDQTLEEMRRINQIRLIQLRQEEQERYDLAQQVEAQARNEGNAQQTPERKPLEQGSSDQGPKN